MTGIQALQSQAWAHGSLRRDLESIIEHWREEADRADQLMQEAETGRECGYREGELQAIQSMIADLEAVLEMDDQNMHPTKGDEEQ